MPTGAIDIAVALIIIAIGAVVMWDSARTGAGWAEDGPQSGYFPFYIGLLMILSSLVNLGRAVLRAKHGDKKHTRVFLEREQARLVLSVLVPTAIFVVLIDFIGLYAAAMLFIGGFMRKLGGYSWLKSIAVAVAVPVAFFCIFELWFLVPLPKGPIEAALGF